MIQFTKPENLDGFYLRKELLKSGVKLISNDILLDGDDLFLNISTKDKNLATEVLEAHNGNTPYLAEINSASQAKADLLERLGITADEAKLLLG